MGKKCVRTVERLRTKMCTSLSYTRSLMTQFWFMCTNSIHPLAYPVPFHSDFSSNSIWIDYRLYPVSTKPTITTKCLENNKTIKTGAGEDL